MLKHLKLCRPLAVIDTETTGVDTSSARIVELAVVRVEPDGRRKDAVWRINPGVPIPAGATALHGITDADVAGRPRFGEIAAELLLATAGADVAGFNAMGYDLPLIAAELTRAGDRDGALRLLSVRSLDVMWVYHSLVPYRRGSPRNLSAAVATYLGRSHAGAHGALADAVAAAEVLDALVDRYSLPREFDRLAEEFAESPYHG